MGIFKRFFGKKDTDPSNAEERGKYMPQEKTPIDEQFTINFKKNGGKFIYCDSNKEIQENFNSILEENNWTAKNVLCFSDQLKERFKTFQLKFNNDNPSFFLTTCESLIANNGSILISSNQIKEQKLDSLPDNFILFATTSQLKENISDGLRTIKNQNKDQIPTNITTLKHFKHSEEKDFLSYGSSSKNLYLLLLEDL